MRFNVDLFFNQIVHVLSRFCVNNLPNFVLIFYFILILNWRTSIFYKNMPENHGFEESQGWFLFRFVLCTFFTSGTSQKKVDLS